MNEQRIIILNKLIGLYQKLILLFMKEQPLIIKMATAIKSYEGYFAPGENVRYPNGTRSWRTKNPGNLKYAGQYGTITMDQNGFAIFNSYEAGWRALISQLTIAANGKSKIYNPEMNFYSFFEKYAPSRDNNNPIVYAEEVARQMGVSPLMTLKQLIIS